MREYEGLIENIKANPKFLLTKEYLLKENPIELEPK